MDAIDRVIQTLEALDSAERPLSLPELQAAVGCPLSTLSATLRTLVRLGYIHHDRSRRTYMPTVLLAELGAWVATRHALEPLLQFRAQTIHKKIGGSVAIAHRNDLRLQYLFLASGDFLGSSVRIGTTRPLCRSGMGWVILSMLPDKAIQSIVRRSNEAAAGEDQIDLDVLLSTIERCRVDGYVYAEHVVRAGYAVVAMPIRTSREPLGISVSDVIGNIAPRREQIVDMMQEALAQSG